MANGVLAQLKVLLGMDISQMKSGLNEAEVRTQQSSKKIEKNFHTLGSSFSRLLGPLSSTGRQVSVAIDAIGASASEAQKSMTAFGTAAAVAGSVATAGFLALAGVTFKLFEQIDQQADLAKGIGLTTSEYVQLTSALKLYGVQQEQVTPGLAQFFKIVSGLMRSKAGAQAIKDLGNGLSLAKLQMMGTHDQLLAIADAFSKFPDGPKKSAIASQLFTATLGAKMIPLLDQGAAGVEKLESKYKSLGDQSEKLAAETKNLSIQFSAAWSALEVGALKASGALGVPTMLLAIAHPLATAKTLILDFGHVFAEVLGGITGGIETFVKATDSAFARFHLPQIPTGELDKARRYFGALSSGFEGEAIKAAGPLFGSGETPSKGGGNLGGNLGGGQTNKAATFLASLKREIAEFGKGDVAKGIDKLKELGATQKQLAEGKGLLGQLDFLKREEDFTKGFEKAQTSFAKAIEKLKVPQATQDGWNRLGDTLNGIVDSLRQAGGEALGLKGNTFAGQLQAQASAAAGIGAGPIGGVVPMFHPGRGRTGDPTGKGQYSPLGSMIVDFDKLNVSARDFGKTLSSSFTRMIETGQGFHQMMGDLLRDMEAFALKQTLFKLIGGLSSKGGFLGVVGNFFGGLSAPGRAAGGQVSAGQLYRVGERGPEYFVPKVSGQIVPHAAGSTKHSTLIYSPNWYINTPNADSFRKSQSQVTGEAYRQMAATHARNG